MTPRWPALNWPKRLSGSSHWWLHSRSRLWLKSPQRTAGWQEQINPVCCSYLSRGGSSGSRRLLGNQDAAREDQVLAVLQGLAVKSQVEACSYVRGWIWAQHGHSPMAKLFHTGGD